MKSVLVTESICVWRNGDGSLSPCVCEYAFLRISIVESNEKSHIRISNENCELEKELGTKSVTFQLCE